MKYRLKDKRDIKDKTEILITKEEVLKMAEDIKKEKEVNGFIFGLERVKEFLK